MRHTLMALATALILAACSQGERSAAGTGMSAEMGSPVADVSGAPLGTVALSSPCDDEATIHLERGLALLHNMTYEDAQAHFAQATETDPECALGYWGQAMTLIHPLWSDPLSAEEFERGSALVKAARERAETDRESAFIEALGGYYDAGRGSSEQPNLIAFEKGWRAFHESYPTDVEGMAFYALAQLATVDPGDKTFGKQRAAGALAEQVLAKVPDHPGGHHYVIHAYDNPALSEEAEDVARSYSDIAPEIPHALHMPTHTFTRLGLWQESIDWNRRSADAALERPLGDQTSLHYFHALDYLAYAYLQGAEDRKALEVHEELKNVAPPYQPHVATAYTLAAVPARIALERHAWEEAAELEARQPGDYPWESAPAMEAITYFARALGAARSGRFDQARADLDVLTELHERVAAASPYWGTQVEIQLLSARAWLQFEEGAREQAHETMRRAADLEARTEKHPVTPGEVLPARELLGDMLLELGMLEDAVAAYSAALERSPNRFNSLYGAGHASELAGDFESARDRYAALVEVASRADTDRPRLLHARAFLSEAEAR